MDYSKVLLAVCPHSKATIRAGFAASMQDAINVADLSTPRRLGVFIGQCAHESAGFLTTTEYASGKAYNGRKDLGNTQPGDGPRFKGRGLIQLTGRSNYRVAGAALGKDFEANPTIVANFPYAAEVSAWYWKSRDINAAADNKVDAQAILLSTKKINGGTNGLSSRTDCIHRAWSALSDLKGTLTTVAAQETKKAKTKAKVAAGAATGGTAPIAVSAHPATQQAASSPSIAVMVLVGLALIGVAVYFVIAANRHQTAATELTAAAQGA